MRFFLIGDEASKRTIYLKKVAESMSVSFQIINWENVEHIFCLDKLKNSVSNEHGEILGKSALQTKGLNSTVLSEKDIVSIENIFLTQESKGIELSVNSELLDMNTFSVDASECFDLENEDTILKRNMFLIHTSKNFDSTRKNTILNQDIVNLELLKGAVIKIDPPSYETVHLSQMKKLLKEYQENLRRMMQMPCQFLNTPEAILKLLDKKETKFQLQSHSVPVTKMFDEDVWRLEQLLELMKKKRCYSVFVKPRYFSGAAGVTAFRIHPGNGKMRLYTSCRMDSNCLVNTKKMVVLEDKQEIDFFMEKLLELGCIVERWYPKAEFKGKSYDLRVVYQFGHIAYIVVRQSGGPITNLHLNNHAMDIKRLGLSQEKLQEIEEVCKEAMEVFPGLNMAGIDILLEKGTLRPLIIEMNGQGDLIYQDIYGKNLIYSEQIEWLMSR